MAGKYAMTWTTTHTYMPGANGILNALEYYRFPKDIDVYPLVWEDNGFSYKHQYWNDWPDIHPVHIDPSVFPDKSGGWIVLFYGAYKAIELLSNYDVVLIWGGDVCPLNDFSEYFEICEKLDRMIVGHNEQGVQSYEEMSKELPYGHTWDVPYADIPIFIPKSCKSILEDVFKIQKFPGNQADWMDSLNYAIRDSGHKPFVVPGTLWILNVTQSGYVRGGNKQDYYFCNQRMNSFHRKYWAAGLCKSYMLPKPGSVSAHNHLVFNRIWNFFNRNCRVKWTEYLEEWDGSL